MANFPPTSRFTPKAVVVGLARPLLPVPDDLAGCQARCHDLMQEIWRLDRRVAVLHASRGAFRMRWSMLKADALDLDRQGKVMDVESFMHQLEQEWPDPDLVEG